MNNRSIIYALTFVFCAAAAPSHANQIWTTDGFFGLQDVFGTDETVYVTGELDVTAEDFIFPTARVYVTRNQVWSGGMGLSDVTLGGYNVIQGTGFAGAFYDEPVWLPVLAKGVYDLVIDEDQNGVYNGIDYVDGEGADWAFRVGAPVGTGIDPAAIAAIKGRASSNYANYQKLATHWHWVADASTAVSAGWAIYSGDLVGLASAAYGVITGWPTDYNAGVLSVGGKVITKLAQAQADHWKSLAADPPDPNYTSFAFLDLQAINDELAAQAGYPGIPDAYPFAPRLGNDSYEAAQLHLSNDMAVMAAIVSALQGSLEKYQGAEAANDDAYTFQQSEAVKGFADMLAAYLADIRDELEDYQTEQSNRGLSDIVYLAAEISALRARLLSQGLTPDEVQSLKDAGFTDADITAMLDRVALVEAPSGDFTRAQTIDDLVASIEATIPDTQELANQAQAVMDDLGPFVFERHPTADANGPYAGSAGAPIVFDGTGSFDPENEALAYAWDFDLDGAFDDAAGITASWTWNIAFSGMVGLQVTDADGLSDIAYAEVAVTAVNQAPVIDAFVPATLTPTASSDQPLAFSVSAHDPDVADLLSVLWTLDGVAVSTDTAWIYTPNPGESGTRVVKVVVSDDDSASPDASEFRVVSINQANPECSVDADCVDSDLCTQDRCVSGICQHPPETCDDGTGCTDDSCDPAVGCIHSANDALCVDGVDCTADRCQPGTGDPVSGCRFQPNDTLCPDDGLSCTVEACDRLNGCLSTPVDSLCSDGDLCTLDRCDAALGCQFTPVPPACGNGCLEADEACDDGNISDGDGCSADCQLPAKLDHFLCYKAKETKGDLCSSVSLTNPGGACVTEEDCGGNSTAPTGLCIKNKFPAGRQVDLSDQFEDGRFDVKGPVSLCNPVEKDGEGIFDAMTHLKGYQIALAKTDPKQPKHIAQRAWVDDQLATLFIETVAPDRLLTPTAKSLDQPGLPPDPTAHNVDHYKCYKVKVGKKLCEANPSLSCKRDADCPTGVCNLGFPKDLTVGVLDQFNQPKVLAVSKPTRLCVPVKKTLVPAGVPELIKQSAEHLMCYSVKPSKGEPRHTSFVGIFVNNQFGPERLDTVGEDELCVTATKTLLSGPLAETLEEGEDDGLLDAEDAGMD